MSTWQLNKVKVSIIASCILNLVLILCCFYTEQQFETEKKKVQSLADVIKNPTKVVLLQVSSKSVWYSLYTSLKILRVTQKKKFATVLSVLLISLLDRTWWAQVTWMKNLNLK